MSDDVVFELDLEAGCEEVYSLLTDLRRLQSWMPVTVFEAWVGGRFELVARGMVAIGWIVRMDPPHQLAYSWDWRDSPLPTPTEVSITLTPVTAGTRLQLRHSGLSPEQESGFAEGWNYYLPRLRATAQGRGWQPDGFATGTA